MSPADCALEAVACLRAGANFREVYTLTRDLPDGLRWEWFDDGTGRLSMRHPTIDRHWEASITASQVSAEEEQQVAEALIETLQAWVRHWQRDEQAALQGGRWEEDSTAGWARVLRRDAPHCDGLGERTRLHVDSEGETGTLQRQRAITRSVRQTTRGRKVFGSEPELNRKFASECFRIKN
jgi:hypothetical protein